MVESDAQEREGGLVIGEVADPPGESESRPPAVGVTVTPSVSDTHPSPVTDTSTPTATHFGQANLPCHFMKMRMKSADET